MPKSGATSVVQSKITDRSETMPSKSIEPIPMRDLVAANSADKHPSVPVVFDIEDMWDNLPV